MFLFFKQLFYSCVDLFQLKFDSKWLSTYELAKVSLNNKGNEIRSAERRSNEARVFPEEQRERCTSRENNDEDPSCSN